jgi:hypothetical protein
MVNLVLSEQNLDCEGDSYFDCEDGYVDDCSGDGDCCPDSWIGDGYSDCEDQPSGCDLTCYNNDGGDCTGSETCGSCEFDFTDYGSECCDTAWEEYGINCSDLEAYYSWDCSGCECPGDPQNDINGCTDSDAYNYNPDATIDDGTCQYSQCQGDMNDDGIINIIDIIDMVNLILSEEEIDCDGDSYFGCMDPLACNYDSNALTDDGSCVYPYPNYDCNNNCVVYVDCFGVCGGAAEYDDCGVCDGDNSSCGDTIIPFEVGFTWIYEVEVFRSTFAIGQGTQTSTSNGIISMVVESYDPSNGVAKLVLSGDLSYQTTVPIPGTNGDDPSIYVREINGVIERSTSSSGPWYSVLEPEASWTNGKLLFAGGNTNYDFYLSSESVTVPAGQFSGFGANAIENQWGEPYTFENFEYIHEEIFAPDVGLLKSYYYSYYNPTDTWEYGPYITQMSIQLTDYGMDVEDPFICANTFEVFGQIDLDGDYVEDECFDDGTAYVVFYWEGDCLATIIEYSNGYEQDISSYGLTEDFVLSGFEPNWTETFILHFEDGSSGTSTATTSSCGRSIELNPKRVHLPRNLDFLHQSL